MKKLLVLMTFLGLTFSLFAQEAKATGLTDKDVEAFCKNYESIYVEMDKLGIDMQDPKSVMQAETADSQATKILNKKGISGKNSFEKVKVICYGYAVEYYDSNVASNPQTALLLKKLGRDPMAEIRSKVAEADQAVIKNHMPELTAVFTDAASNFSEDEINAYTENSEQADYARLAAAFLSANANQNSTEEPSKYDTKKKFNIKRYARQVWILVDPSEITFENSKEAEEYAYNYEGVAGKWEMVTSYGYLGLNNDKKPFYVWTDGGIAYYSKFPIDEDTGKPDKFIPDNKVKPDIAKQAILQMVKVGD
jgi:hypothetical protein